MPVVNYDWDELEDNIVEEYDDAGATLADYTTEPDHFGNVISQHRDGQSSFFHYDGQGSTLAVTDEDQNVTDTLAYSAFGETTESARSTVFPFRYIGEKANYQDPITGEYQSRGTIYQPIMARWLVPLSPLQVMRFLREETIAYHDEFTFGTYGTVIAVFAPLMTLVPDATTDESEQLKGRPVLGDIDTGSGRVIDMKLGECGRVFMPWLWEIGKAPCDGFLIQHIMKYKVIYDCCTTWSFSGCECMLPLVDEFWEIIAAPPDYLHRKGAKVLELDEWLSRGSGVDAEGFILNNAGEIHIRGDMRFYCQKDILPEDPPKWPPGKPGQSKHPTRQKKPGFWETVPQSRGFNQLTNKWNCCPPNQVNSVDFKWLIVSPGNRQGGP